MVKTLKAAGAAGAMLVLAGCAQVHDCLTRAELPAEPRPGVALDLAPGTYPGQVALPDPSNWAVGLRFTGERCQTRIRHAGGRVLAETSGVPGPVVLTTQVGEGPFYLGALADGSVLVVQVHPGGVTTTHTTFDEAGVLIYGKCGGDRGTFGRECVGDH